MVLLDCLVERGLAEEEEAEANPHGQQPRHGEASLCGDKNVAWEGWDTVVLQHAAMSTTQKHNKRRTSVAT